MTNSTPTSLSHRQILTILSGLLLGIFLAALDQNIVSVAIVPIANDLHGFDEQAWATTAYLITATVSTPLYGKLADIYGRKPCYLIAIGLFVLGSIACTFATSMYELAAFRAFQGLGAGGLMSLAFTILSDIVPARERVRYQGYFMAVFGSSTVLGPVLGGFFSGYDQLARLDGWRWVFLVNVPIGVLAFVVVAKFLNVPHQRRKQRIDWFGALMLTVGVVPLLIIAEQGREWGWESERALICYGVAASGVLLFVIVELLMKDAALIPMRLFDNSTFSVSVLGGFIVGVAMFGAIVLVPLYFQVVRGYSPTKSGLLMLPLVVGIMIGGQISGMVTQRTGRYKVLPVAGCFLIAIGAVLHAQVEFDSPLWQPLVCGGVIGAGLGFCMQTLIIAAQNAGPRQDMGVSTATATFFRQMGGTLGVAIFLTILFNLLPHKIIDAFGGQLPEGFDAARLGGIISDTSGIGTMPEDLRTPVLIGFTDAMNGVFYTAAGIALVAGLVLLFMRELPLQDDPIDVLIAAEAGREPLPVEEHDWDGAAQALMSEPEPALEVTAPVDIVGDEDEATPAEFEQGQPSLTGRIHHEDGRPVPDAALTLIDKRGHQVTRATGDSYGDYAIYAPEPGTYVLIVSAAGHQPTAISVVAGPWPQQLNLTLMGSSEVSGVIRSVVSGNPIDGATVTLTDRRGEVVGAAISTEDGHFVCHDVVSGSYTLVVIADHMRPYAAALTVPPTGLLRHDIEMDPMAVLAGIAVADGRPVPDVQIMVLDVAGDLTATVRTDDEGQYVVPDLPEGEYTVVARGYPPVTSRVTVSGGEVEHDVRLGYGREIDTELLDRAEANG
ncbi:MFS transporter [Nocardia goodfellowii]|uniref:EmrB/QacA subfamily drug resistance transporter n=1 Tax=Nocardia goodfellowii TaxID=882446 RepID=A0ABS4QRP9_9NOCA|nr:MFS transporter [Nocardia goodfellowii]MBP2194392.1 EmrB/QacA subfamily drug resistance transporter [Nocardia goodfellowii]